MHIQVNPSNRLFNELGNTDYTTEECLAEFIDNSLSARNGTVTVDIVFDEDQIAKTITITDNASGIPLNTLGDAISPAMRKEKNSLNEHGLGLKQAVAHLGTLESIITRTEGDLSGAHKVSEFKFGRLEVEEVPEFHKPYGTIVCIKDLKHAGRFTKRIRSVTIIPYLGARYRRFLDRGELILILNGEQVEAQHPVYYHDAKRKNIPVINKFKLSGEDWSALLTFGYAPMRQTEWSNLNLEEFKHGHPYKVGLKTQGLDILLNDRVICFHEFSAFADKDKHGHYNNVRGEIELVKGFTSTTTKNKIYVNKNYEEMCKQVNGVLTGNRPGPRADTKNYLPNTIKRVVDKKAKLENIPESMLRDRLAKLLLTPTHDHTTAEKEYLVEGISGQIDIFVDEDEVWELKKDQARALDVYQVLMYMDHTFVDKGVLVAKSYSDGCKTALEFINSKERKIVFKPLDTLAITQDMNEEEYRQEYEPPNRKNIQSPE